MFRNDIDDLAKLYLNEPEPMVAIRNSCPDNLKKMQMSYSDCRILSLLLQMIAANRVLELGTLVGCSAAWIAKSLCGDNPKVITIEKSQKHYQIAQRNIQNAKLDHIVTCIHSDGLTALKEYSHTNLFDAIFIDAKKIEYIDYLNLAKKCVRSGGLIIADNTLMMSETMLEISNVIRNFHHLIENDSELVQATLPTISGMTIAMKI